MRRKLTLLITTLVVALCLGRANPAWAQEAAPYPVWWSPSLDLESLDKIDQRLAMKFPPKTGRGVTLYKGERPDDAEAFIDSCVSYDKFRKEGYYARSNHSEQILRFHWSFCTALEMLRSAKPSRISYVNDVTLNPDIVDYFPAMVNLTGACEFLCRQYVANERRIPWSKFEAPEIESIDVVNPYQMRVKTRAMSMTLEILARADFNEDGLEDLLVRVDGGAIRGTWGTTNLFTLTRDRRESVLWVLEAEQHLCPAEYHTCKEVKSFLRSPSNPN